jgi:hypothetical protein
MVVGAEVTAEVMAVGAAIVAVVTPELGQAMRVVGAEKAALAVVMQAAGPVGMPALARVAPVVVGMLVPREAVEMQVAGPVGQAAEMPAVVPRDRAETQALARRAVKGQVVREA